MKHLLCYSMLLLTLVMTGCSSGDDFGTREDLSSYQPFDKPNTHDVIRGEDQDGNPYY